MRGIVKNVYFRFRMTNSELLINPRAMHAPIVSRPLNYMYLKQLKYACNFALKNCKICAKNLGQFYLKMQGHFYALEKSTKNSSRTLSS